MKKSLTLVLTMCVASAMVLSACGESKTQETTAETTTVETTAAAEESSEEAEEDKSEEADETEEASEADETEEKSEEADETEKKAEETTEAVAAETEKATEKAAETEEAAEEDAAEAEEASEEAPAEAAEPEEAPEEQAEAEPAAPAEKGKVVVPIFKMSEKAAEAPAAEAPAGESAEGEAADSASSDAIGKQTEEMEITVDGVTAVAQYEDVEDGTSEVRHFKVTFDGKEYYGTIDKGVWAADDAEGEAVIAAYQEAHESDPSFMGAPGSGGSGDGESAEGEAPAGEAAEAPAESAEGAAAEGETPPAKPEGNPPEGAPAEPGEPAEAAASEEAAAEVTVTFSTGETATAVVGEPFEFFFQCDAPGDMGAPADGEEGAGITVSSGTVEYSNVGLGGPNSYPTSEKVTITGFEGDFEVTVCDEATAMDATHTIYFDAAEIEDAIANAEAMAAQMAENPMDGGSEEGGAAGESAEAPAGEQGEAAAPAEQGAPAEAAPAAEEKNIVVPIFKMSEKAAAETPAAEASAGESAEGEAADSASSDAIGKQTEEMEITVDGVTGLAQYEDVEDGTSEVRHFKVTFDGKEYYGTIDKGVWAADDAEGEAVIAAYQEAHESDPSFMGAPGSGGSGDGESAEGEAPAEPGESAETATPAAGETLISNSIIQDILNGTSSLIDRSKFQTAPAAEAPAAEEAPAADSDAASDGESMGDMSDAPEIPEGLEPGEEPPGGFGGID